MPDAMGRDTWNSGLAQTGLKIGDALTGVADAPAQLIYKTWSSSGQQDTITNVTFTNQATLQKPWADKKTYMFACIQLPPSVDSDQQETFISQFTGTQAISGVMQFAGDNCTIPSLTASIFDSKIDKIVRKRASYTFCSTKMGTTQATEADCKKDAPAMNKQGGFTAPTGSPGNAYPTRSIAIFGPELSQLGWFQSNWKNILKTETDIFVAELVVATVLAVGYSCGMTVFGCAIAL